MYAVMGIVFGFMFFIQKKDILRPAMACRAIIGKAAEDPATQRTPHSELVTWLE